MGWRHSAPPAQHCCRITTRWPRMSWRGSSVAMTTSLAVVLVAGGGTRLRPLTDTRPTALVPLGDGGETILGRAIRVLASAGVENVVLATGCFEDAVRAAMVDAPVTVTLCRNDAWDRTQNIASLHVCAG